jgi:L-amino acid N-acyltransferase YncA
LWEWANEEQVRAASFSSAPISWETHKIWFEKKLKQNGCCIFIAESEQGSPFGQVRFDLRPDGDYEIAVSIARDWRGRRLATPLLEAVLSTFGAKHWGCTIHAFIKSQNYASLKSFAKSGFIEIGIEDVRGQAAAHFIYKKKLRSGEMSEIITFQKSERIANQNVEPPVGVAISQPTYLPWIGYFDLIDQADCFVILDSVQFERQSWQQRNRIKTPTGLQWLTVPVVFRGKLEQRIQDVEIRSSDFVHKHLRAIELNYRRSPYFEMHFPQVTGILESHGRAGMALLDLNLQFMQWFCAALDIKKPLVRSSELVESGRRVELLVNLCRRLNADSYLSALGAASYLMNELPRFAQNGIRVEFHNYTHPSYKQLFPPFCPYATALDLIFNEGPRSVEIIRSGRNRPLTPDQVALSAREVRS